MPGDKQPPDPPNPSEDFLFQGEFPFAELQDRLTKEFLDVDTLAQIVLKGHLVVEELLTESISAFVWHPDFVERMRLTFDKKLTLSRALSIQQQKNGMWDLVKKLNDLRNHLAHSSKEAERKKKIDLLQKSYFREFPREKFLFPPPGSEETDEDIVLAMMTIFMSMQFLRGHLEEVRHFRRCVNEMKAVLIPMKWGQSE